jgi:flagellar protein FlgJ
MDMKIDPQLLASRALEQKKNATDAQKNDPQKLKEACQQFEALFVNSMFKEMRKSVPTDGLLPPNGGQQMFQEMMDWEVAQKASATQGIGIAEALYRHLQGPVEYKKP